MTCPGGGLSLFKSYWAGSKATILKASPMNALTSPYYLLVWVMPAVVGSLHSNPARKYKAGALFIGIGLLSLICSAVSPDDDLLQSDVMSPAPRAVNAVLCVRATTSRPPRVSLIGAFFVNKYSAVSERTGRSTLAEFHQLLRFHIPESITIHSPPIVW